jgi:hypothetical protein
VNFTNKKSPISVVWHGSLWDDKTLGHARETRKDRLLGKLHEIVLSIAAREGPLKLRKSDLELLHGTTWDVLRTGCK